MNILAIQWGHDSSAALMMNGKIIAACEQERYSRDKHSKKFPVDAIGDCLRTGGISIADVDEIAYTLDPILLIREYYLRPGLDDRQRIALMIDDIDRVKEVFSTESVIREKTGFTGPIHFYLHHLCHLASSYYPSGFDRTITVSYDGVGEFQTGLLGLGENGSIRIINEENRFPHSLGMLYAAVTHYLGWKYNCDEGIVMGLAPFGNAHEKIPGRGETYSEIFEQILRPRGKYGIEIDLSWVAYHRARSQWVSEKFIETFGPKRVPETPHTQEHANVAAALQNRLEEVVLEQLRTAREEFQCDRLTLAGGVALNCSLNGKIERSRIFSEIFVQPGSGDNGLVIGACHLAWVRAGRNANVRRDHNYYLGSGFSNEAIEAALEKSGEAYKKPEDLFQETADRIARGKIVGWFQGRAEFGPRALGNRSILTRPFPAEMKDYVNNQVKFREAFRPFAPAVLAERTSEYFEIGQPTPHMLIACMVRPEKRDVIPAVVHVDGTCRVQTVTPENNERFYRLLQAFDRITGVPVLLNTSFNVKGQPIVNTPQEAIDCFRSTKIDTLVIGDFILDKI